jgi:coenzyme F420-0:L-glutamate ligase/coenzyme F420-1:gamma-L-glutamate ligase
LSLTALPGLPAVEPGADLAQLIADACRGAGLKLADDDVVLVAQKIFSKSESRAVELCAVEPGARALALAERCGKDPRIVELILRESREVLRCRPGLIIAVHRLGLVMANAGIDQSNVGGAGRALLLPVDPDASCRGLRARLRAVMGVAPAVIMIDSFGRAWRNGTIGTAIGVAGYPALVDLRGKADLFGRAMEVTEVAAADELAAAASLLMGQAAEGLPVVIARGAPYGRREGGAGELIRPEEKDLFR